MVRLEVEKTDLDQENQGSSEESCLIETQEQASLKTDQITDQTSNQTSAPTAGYEKGNSTSKEEKNSNSETSGTYVESIQQIYLEDPIKVYNFEVEDSHTYYIGEQEVLVHNLCGAPEDEGGVEIVNKAEEDILSQEKHYTPDQQALIDLAKEAKKNGGSSLDEANILLKWADEYNVSAHGPEIHPKRPGIASNILHFHIGKTGHIPIN